MLLGGEILAQEIGEDALTIKMEIEYYVKNYYDSNGYKQIKMRIETKYYNGNISEVILYQENVPALDEKLLGRTFDFKTRYIIKDNLLNCLITEYNNLTIEELKSIVDDKNKIENYYFNNNYTNYSKVYLNTNGLATKMYKKTNLNELPLNIKSIIQIKKDEISLKDNNKRQTIKIAHPNYEVDAEGVVVVEVSVDKSGNVIKARNTSKSTTNNKNLIDSSIQAAMKYKFSPIEKDTVTIETITNNFKLE